MQTECLVRNESRDGVLHINVRFLQPMAREVGAFKSPIANLLPNEEPSFEIVPELRVDENVYQTWQEAVERSVELPKISLNAATEIVHDFEFPSSREVEPIRDGNGKIPAMLLRRCEALAGSVEVKVESIDKIAAKITVRILNRTPVPKPDLDNQDAIITRSFTSTHTILHAEGGEFVSSLDPVPEYAVGADCRNIGSWPVLVGDEKENERDAMLSSPIILYDYPKIAPESAGDLHDGTEIDEILTLRVQTMTDAEKDEMRRVDEAARRILERTEGLSGDDLLKMHGAMRDVRMSGEDFFNPATRLQSYTVQGVELKAGDRVRIRPKKRADVMDIALAGKIAIIEAVEQDVENEVHFALVLEDDPGRELGLMRQPGHRFFYGADEVEPIRE